MLRDSRYKYVYSPENPDSCSTARRTPANPVDATAYAGVRDQQEQRLRKRATPDPETVDGERPRINGTGGNVQ